jgi:S-adenosylmethionine decarboxylase proenzyme
LNQLEPLGILILKSLGTQILLDLENCNSDILDDIDLIKNILKEAASLSGATIIGETFHKFQPVGVTGVVSIAESHICIHTWPEYSYASVDIFSCGDDFNLETASQIIGQRLESTDSFSRVIERGLRDGQSNEDSNK